MFVRMLRRPTRHHHERVSLQETNDGNTDGSNDTGTEATPRQDATTSSNNTTGDTGLSPTTANGENLGEATADTEAEYDADEPSIAVHPRPTTHPFLTSQIDVERQIRQRRQSTCTILLLFLLCRLWIEAIIQKDVALMFLSTMGTTWTYRYWCSRREEEEYDRQIEDNPRSATAPNNANRSEGNQNADAASTFDPDLGLMSFQAQLALAILESQRQMFENGGYGGNDAHTQDETGVTEEAKAKWKKYEWGGEGSSELKRLASTNSIEAMSESQGSGNSANYGSVEEDEEEGRCLEVSTSKLEEGLVLSGEDEEPSCSICLCEYETGESVMRLPCNHIYHESCVNSWVTNHVR